MTQDEEPPPLAPHRVALRAAASAAPAAPLCGVAIVLTAALVGAAVPVMLVVGGAVGAVMTAAFVVATETVRRVRPAARLPLLLAGGPFLPVLAGLAGVWVDALPAGPEQAARAVAEATTGLLEELHEVLPGLASILVPFAAAGAARAGGLPGHLGRRPPLQVEVQVVLVAAAVGGALAVSTQRSWHNRTILIGAFALLPLAVLLACEAGERLEAKLLAWHARRLEEAP